MWCRLSILAVALILLLLGAYLAPRGMEALIVVRDIAAGAGPSQLKKKTPTPVRKTINYVFEGHNDRADIYWPGDGQEASAVVVLVPGVVRQGKDDPRLVTFAHTMARAQFLVFVPDLANLRRQNISTRDVSALSRAVRYIASRTDVGTDASIGMIAFSYAAGPTLLAAIAEESRQTVRFVYTIGTYFNVEAVATFLTTGYFRRDRDSEWKRLEPSVNAKWVFVLSCVPFLEDPNDRRLLRAAAEAKISDPDVEVSSLLAQLGPEGRSIYLLLANSDPNEVPELFDNLPDPVLSEFRALDLSARDLSALRARLALIHGQDDRLTPYTESINLASAAGKDRARLFIVRSMKHIEPKFSRLTDVFTLWRAVRMLLKERDQMPRPSGLSEAFSDGDTERIIK